ncbi:ATP-binding protein [Magnetospirillum sp. LM-5]|uniref:sensor histidine kinase n=1 Tax=Magnetospirillum sp. LM-5 TaxID=2681466 RepID=UPI0020C1DB96|nr:ATP-binding protein [Magnetospirillum sp. LM-5]
MAVLVLVCLIPAWLFGVFTSVSTYDRDRRVVEETLQTAARLQLALLERKMASVETALHALSLSPHLDQGDFAAFHAEAQAVARYAQALNIVVLNRAGAQLVNTLMPVGAALPTQPPPFFAAIADRPKPFLSDLFIGPVTGKPLIALTVPAIRDGRVAFMIGMSLDAGQLGALLTEARFPPDWVAAIIDGAGTIAAGTRAPERFVGQKTVPDLLDARARAAAGIIETHAVDGLPTLAAFSRSAQSGWTVAVGVPRDTLEAQLRQTLLHSMMVAVVVLVLALLLARWLGRQISGPVSALVPLAIAIGHDEAVSARPLGLREADEVAAALARASALIRQRTTERDEAHDRESGLRHANAELEQFAYIASHDLREPLRMISSYIGLLAQRYGDRLDGDGRDFLEFARDGAKRMDRMVLDLLELSRVGRTSEEFAPVALADIVASALENLALTIAECQAAISVAHDLPVVTGLAGELERLVQNLVANALKYRHPDRTPYIAIAARREGAEWVVSIADNGIGIEPEFHERIFGIFQRLHARDKYEGSGIGLAISRKIVEHHGGRIWVESAPGGGTTLFFTLPDAGFKA